MQAKDLRPTQMYKLFRMHSCSLFIGYKHTAVQTCRARLQPAFKYLLALAGCSHAQFSNCSFIKTFQEQHYIYSS